MRTIRPLTIYRPEHSPGQDVRSGHGRDALVIGTVRVPGRAILAPMAGVTDLGMRRVACRFGAPLTVSEMVAAGSFSTGGVEARQRAGSGGLGIPAVQIAGCEPGSMAEAARAVEGQGAALIDINMGCPAKRVTGGLSGSALMRDLDHAARLIEAVVGAVRVPVTVKMRLGWDWDVVNAPALASRAEALGAALVTVHGRTRNQFYTGRADWGAVRAVKAALRAIPLVVNGDCASPVDAFAMRDASGADAVMIGRAAVGRPWLVGAVADALATGEPDQPEPSVEARLAGAVEHLDSILTVFGRDKGLRHARKHLAAYAEHAGPPTPRRAALRLQLVTTTDPSAVPGLLAEVFEPERADAMEIAA